MVYQKEASHCGASFSMLKNKKKSFFCGTEKHLYERYHIFATSMKKLFNKWQMRIRKEIINNVGDFCRIYINLI